MVVKNEGGREIEIDGVSGYSDDIQFEAYYIDDSKAISEEDYDYVQETYASELYDEWVQKQVMHAEFLADLAQDR